MLMEIKGKPISVVVTEAAKNIPILELWYE